MYGLHNANLLRKAIPRSLTAPQPIYEDRRSHHDQIAIKLRQNQAEKRKRTQEKRKATLAQKAKNQAVYAGESFETMEEPSDDEEDVMEEEEGFILDNEDSIVTSQPRRKRLRTE